MFDQSADLYDALYDALGKDYAAEAAAVLAVARTHSPGAASLLDVACGTGRHLAHFARDLRVAGVDLDPGLLAVAHTRCGPDIVLAEADMVDFDLDERFDVVTCLFSSIGYAGTVDRLRRAVASMARHLTHGGVLIVEPWFQPGVWEEGRLHLLVVDRPDLKVTRMSRAGRRGDIAVLDFHYLVGDEVGVRHFVEDHELALFTWDEYQEAFERAGLATEIDPDGLSGRGLVVGVARGGVRGGPV